MAAIVVNSKTNKKRVPSEKKNLIKKIKLNHINKNQ